MSALPEGGRDVVEARSPCPTVLTDIAASSFDASTTGLDVATLMGRIHGRVLATGQIIEGVEVFRRAYDAIGFGLLVRATRVAPIAALLERGYAWFARNRLRLTGREADVCTTERCAVAPAHAR